MSGAQVRFKPGDKVLIHRYIESHSGGWRNSWNHSRMDPYVGEKTAYTITKVTEHGVYLDIPAVEMKQIGWPPQGLRLAAECLLTKEQLVAERIKKLWNQSRWVKNNPTQAY